MSLPSYIAPMLAKSSAPFDSPEHLYEVKWDGTRSIAFIEGGSYRLVNRRRFDMTERYPEMASLGGLGDGIVLDGELVVLKDGQPDFSLLLSREHIRSAFKIKTASRANPATFMVFDQLYADFKALIGEPLSERRERLRETLVRGGGDRIVFSDGVVEQGKAFFDQVRRRGLEGVMAKRLNSTYLPGKRSDAWLKIKARLKMHCAILGFVPSEGPPGERDFRSLIIATLAEDGELRPVGKVGSGIDGRVRKELNSLLWSRLRDRPLVPCKLPGKWVEPGLYCTVSYFERTVNGELRAPVFEELHAK